MEKAIDLGYRGVAGFDVALTTEGELKVLDLNFRLNGSTAALLLYPSASKAFKSPVGRLQFLYGKASFAQLARVVREAIAARFFLPLCIYDPTASIEPRSSPSVCGIVLGQSRQEVAAKLRYLNTQGLYSNEFDERIAMQGLSRQAA
jgi:hypothetical protein